MSTIRTSCRSTQTSQHSPAISPFYPIPTGQVPEDNSKLDAKIKGTNGIQLIADLLYLVAPASRPSVIESPTKEETCQFPINNLLWLGTFFLSLQFRSFFKLLLSVSAPCSLRSKSTLWLVELLNSFFDQVLCVSACVNSYLMVLAMAGDCIVRE